MARLFTIATVLALLVLGICLYRGRISPQARTARPYAQQFAQHLRSDARFTNVQVRVWEVGSKGPVYVHGRVCSDADAAELRRTFDTLGCPVGVSWDVVVDTNLIRGIR
jgi:hypothetical protein